MMISRLHTSDMNVNPRMNDSGDILFNSPNLQKKGNMQLRTATAPQDLIHFSNSIMGATHTTDTTKHTTRGEGGVKTQISTRINNTNYTASQNFGLDKPKI